MKQKFRTLTTFLGGVVLGMLLYYYLITRQDFDEGDIAMTIVSLGGFGALCEGIYDKFKRDERKRDD